MKIGRPGYKVAKIRDPVTKKVGMFFQLQFPQITKGVKPRYRFMSAWEQRVEQPSDKRIQYLIIAAEPYESVAFKVQSRKIDTREGQMYTHWDPDTKQCSLQLFFKTEREERYAGVPGLAPSQ